MCVILVIPMLNEHNHTSTKRQFGSTSENERKGGKMTPHRLLLSVEHASTALEFNAFLQQRSARRPSGEITACSRLGIMDK